MAVPPSFLVQLSIGSVYAWSMWNTPLTRELGVVASSADDWTLGTVVPVFSCTATFLGITTFFLGPWAERAGPKMVASAAALSYSSGCLLSSLGCYYHSLPLIYLGYGVFGGIGWGLGYISPVSTLLKWFPDRRGLASGLALTAFGGGAVLAAPTIKYLQDLNFKAPEFVGSLCETTLVTQEGRQFAEIAGQLKEVVVATAHDVAELPGLSEGVYLVGTGDPV